MNNLFRNNIGRDEIDLLDTCQFGGLIHVIDRTEYIEGAVSRLRKEKVIGFDTETKPNFRKGRPNKVALIQFATLEEAFLFRVNKTGITGELISLFEDEEVIKIGVGIRDDIRKMRSLLEFKPAGFLELQHYSGFYGIESNSLRKLAAIVLGFKISKSQQLTDWEGRTLTESQQRYAATDAWAGLKIYKTLQNSIPG